ncbi:hypothetical protein T12_2921 [Trichinella patagoniensis]|uniref:Uncharacterized protein n=1 Tax=Trichinella patagoniensis TaxID=990121 RepID=A0A0V0Z675_9BILA|nr:hypothetical protein T12_2921 [Trichinella patagoniensis]
MRACENKNRILNDHHRLTNNEMHCYSNMAVLHECYDKNFYIFTKQPSCCPVGFTSLCSLDVLLSQYAYLTAGK